MGFRERRVSAGLTVHEVACKLDVTDAAVYLWETAHSTPRPKMLVRLADIYKCTVDELLREEKEE